MEKLLDRYYLVKENRVELEKLIKTRRSKDLCLQSELEILKKEEKSLEKKCKLAKLTGFNF